MSIEDEMRLAVKRVTEATGAHPDTVKISWQTVDGEDEPWCVEVHMKRRGRSTHFTFAGGCGDTIDSAIEAAAKDVFAWIAAGEYELLKID